ncbi:MAG: putative Ig domain-containing protein [Verrucomicrobiota bacterium]
MSIKIPFAVLACSLIALANSPASPEILTPPAGPTPQINGPRVFGVHPGSPILFQIPVTGTRPIAYSAEGLPAEIKLDSKTGILTGTLTKPGVFRVTLHATNAHGTVARDFKLVAGGEIALTPPMGWNSWNCWGGAVSQEKVLSSARALVASGLRDHGWRFINIDDGWQGVRGGANLAIQPNSKFPDMGQLGSELHAMGLGFGIYSSPWCGTYEGHIGSSCDNPDGTYGWIVSGDHNEFFRISKDSAQLSDKRHSNYRFGAHSFIGADVTQWAAWGVDYLKYDWNPNDVAHTREMADALRSSGRDIVYSLSNNTPFKEAADITPLAQLWRTTGDISDTWKSVSEIGFGQQDQWKPFQRPGHWNDPDMLVVGKVGWGKPHPSRLTPDEQYTHISLWCLFSAPLLIGCDLAELDDFTLGLLTNDEVLAVDQDSLGLFPTRIVNDGTRVVYAKPLEDGSVAVGLFNLGESPARVEVKLSELKFTGPVKARDLWRQKDEGNVKDLYSAEINPHGVKLVRLIPAG